MREEKRSPLGLYTIGIAALFLAGFLLLVVFGAKSYQRTTDGQNKNMHSRALLSYLSTTIKAYDTSGAVSVQGTEEDGQVLWLRDGSSGYALRIYVRDGMLLEDYAAESAALRPEEAQRIGETEQFEILFLAEDSLQVTTDAGSVLLHLRSGEASK